MNIENNLTFKGKGTKYFGIVVVNWLFTALSLGIYYPWAKVKQLQYLYQSTTLNDSAFRFEGKGKEMFIGFIKAIVLILMLFGIYALLGSLGYQYIAEIVLSLAYISIIPITIHGSYRYRMSRSSWRAIRFGYRGKKGEFFVKFVQYIFFTVITFGLYIPWMIIGIRTYILEHIRFGNLRLKYQGSGGEFFLLNFKGIILTLLTLGIYFFWWKKELFNFYVNNIAVYDNGKTLGVKLHSTAGGFDVLGLYLGNLLIIIFTLGLGHAFVVTRMMNFSIKNIKIIGMIDLDSVIQKEEVYDDASAEDVADFLDLDLII